MTNKNTQNYFSTFSPKVATRLAIGRYALFQYARGTLHSYGVQDFIGSFLNKYFSRRIQLAQAYYLGTPLMPEYLFEPYAQWIYSQTVPKEVTGGIQLYSTSGSGRPVTNSELLLYYRLGCELIGPQ